MCAIFAVYKPVKTDNKTMVKLAGNGINRLKLNGGGLWTRRRSVQHTTMIVPTPTEGAATLRLPLFVVCKR